MDTGFVRGGHFQGIIWIRKGARKVNNIDTIIYLIDWNRSEEEQQKGIAMAREVKCLKAFCRPYSKSVWENCARILCERSDDELIAYTTDMLMWLEDINHPGALLILQRLARFTRVDLLAFIIPYMARALSAISEERWLTAIANLLYNKRLRETLDAETIQILMPFYNEIVAKSMIE